MLAFIYRMYEALTKEVASEIMLYLEAHPTASDTPDGIANWWIHRQRYLLGLEKVKEALKYLEEKGLVSRQLNLDGHLVYSANTERTSG